MIRLSLIPALFFIFPVIWQTQMATVWAQAPAESQPAETENPDVETPEAESQPSEAETEAESPDIAEPTVPEGYQVVTGDRWSFAVPSDWQNVLSAPAELENNTRVVAQLNDSQKQIVVNLVVQSYEGESSDYLQQSIDSLSNLGVTIHTQAPISLATTQESEVEGVDLDVSLESSEPPTRILQRLVADDGIGFALACGGKEENFEAARSVCTAILNSLQITPR